MLMSDKVVQELMGEQVNIGDSDIFQMGPGGGGGGDLNI